PGDKGLPGTFSKSPWKAPATPRPSPLSAHPWHPGAPRPLLPQQHPGTALAAPSADRFRMKEPFFPPKAAPPAHPHPLPSAWSETEQGRAKGRTLTLHVLLSPPLPPLPSEETPEKQGTAPELPGDLGQRVPTPHKGLPGHGCVLLSLALMVRRDADTAGRHG
ncbi:hypothetical protein Nmel_017590, partial [Mimus melanotis]